MSQIVLVWPNSSHNMLMPKQLWGRTSQTYSTFKKLHLCKLKRQKNPLTRLNVAIFAGDRKHLLLKDTHSKQFRSSLEITRLILIRLNASARTLAMSPSMSTKTKFTVKSIKAESYCTMPRSFSEAFYSSNRILTLRTSLYFDKKSRVLSAFWFRFFKWIPYSTLQDMQALPCFSIDT